MNKKRKLFVQWLAGSLLYLEKRRVLVWPKQYMVESTSGQTACVNLLPQTNHLSDSPLLHAYMTAVAAGALYPWDNYMQYLYVLMDIFKM